MSDRMPKEWAVMILIEETGDETVARATMTIEGESVGGWGRARKNRVDPSVPRIGDELAAARALSDLSHRILEVAAIEVDQFSAGPVRLHP